MAKPKLIPLECCTQGEYGPWWAYTRDEIVAVRKRDVRGVVDQLMIMGKHDILDLGHGKTPRYLRVKDGPLGKYPPVVVMPKKQYVDSFGE